MSSTVIAKENKITEGSIMRGMLGYFLTLLLGAFFQQFYNLSLIHI